MAKNKIIHSSLNFVIWLTGIIVSLSVAWVMINGILDLPWILDYVAKIAGWIVIITTLLGIILAIADYFT